MVSLANIQWTKKYERYRIDAVTISNFLHGRYMFYQIELYKKGHQSSLINLYKTSSVLKSTSLKRWNPTTANVSTHIATLFAHGRVSTRAHRCIGIRDEEQPSKVPRLVPARSAVALRKLKSPPHSTHEQCFVKEHLIYLQVVLYSHLNWISISLYLL